MQFMQATQRSSGSVSQSVVSRSIKWLVGQTGKLFGQSDR